MRSLPPQGTFADVLFERAFYIQFILITNLPTFNLNLS